MTISVFIANSVRDVSFKWHHEKLYLYLTFRTLDGFDSMALSRSCPPKLKAKNMCWAYV